MADISKIKLPNGTTYDIKDENTYSQAVENAVTLGYSAKNLLNIPQTITVNLYTAGELQLKAGDYIFSGTIMSTDNNQQKTLRLLYSTNINDFESIIIKDRDVLFTLRKDCIRYELYAGEGYTTSNGHTTTYQNLMIRDARITDDTYVPYKRTIDERLSALEELLAGQN